MAGLTGAMSQVMMMNGDSDAGPIVIDYHLNHSKTELAKVKIRDVDENDSNPILEHNNYCYRVVRTGPMAEVMKATAMLDSVGPLTFYPGFESDQIH